MSTRNGLKRAAEELPSTRDKLVICAAELVGTALLVLFGCMGLVPFGGAAIHLNAALGFGMAVMFVLQTFAHISGAHINPAVTVAAAVYGILPYLMVPFYITAQMIGAVIGFGVLRAVTPVKFLKVTEVFDSVTNITTYGPGVCTTVPSSNLNFMQAFLIEYLATMVLIFVCCGVWDKRNKLFGDSTPMRFGLTVFGLALVAGPYTGCSMNPARTFGPALWNGNWDAHWVYWIGPLLAAATTAGFYRFVFAQPEPHEPARHEELPLNSTDRKVQIEQKL